MIKTRKVRHYKSVKIYILLSTVLPQSTVRLWQEASPILTFRNPKEEAHHALRAWPPQWV